MIMCHQAYPPPETGVRHEHKLQKVGDSALLCCAYCIMAQRECGRNKASLFHLAPLFALAPNGLTLIDMENEEKKNIVRGVHACCIGSCLGSVATFVLSMALMVFFRGKPPFNEIDLVFYLFIGFISGGVLGFILYAAKKRRH